MIDNVYGPLKNYECATAAMQTQAAENVILSYMPTHSASLLSDLHSL